MSEAADKKTDVDPDPKDPDPDDNDDGTTVEELTEQLNRAVREKNTTAKLTRKLKIRVEELEAAEDARLEADAGKNKDSLNTLLEKTKTRLAETEKERNEAKEAVRTHILKEKVQKLAKDVIHADAFDDFWALYGTQFELDEDKTPRVVDEIDSVPAFLKGIAESKKHFAAARQAKGSGDVKPGEKVDTGGTVTCSELTKMGNSERIATLAKKENRALRKEWATYRTG